jgi:hypothetical protein
MIQEDPDIAWRVGHEAHGTEEVIAAGSDPADSVVGRQSAVNVLLPGHTSGA